MRAPEKSDNPVAEANAETKTAPAQTRDPMPLWGSLLAALPLLYVLSIGPVGLIAGKAGLPSGPIRSFYTPLIWLHDHTFLKQPLEWYVALWGVK